MRAEVRAIDAELWRLIKQCGAHQLRFGAKRASSACLNDVLILLLAHAKLPWHPLDHPLRGEPLVHQAEQANAGHAICAQVLARVVGPEACLHALDCF